MKSIIIAIGDLLFEDLSMIAVDIGLSQTK